MDAVGRLRRRAAAFAHAWRVVRHDVDNEIADVAEDIEYRWPTVLAWAASGAVIVVGLSRLLLLLTVGAHSAIAVAGVGLVCVVSAACVSGLAWIDWRTRRRGEEQGVQFVVGAGVSLITIGVCIEAFAGVTTVLWNGDLITGSARIEPMLWRSEVYYLWHLVNWIPLLHIVEGVEWREPELFGDPISGALLLGLKVLLLAPLLRIAIGAYRWVTASLLEEESKGLQRRALRAIAGEDQAQAPGHPTGEETTRIRWPAVVLLAASPVIAAALLPLIFEPGHGLDGWWTQRVHGTRFAFLRTAPQWISVVALVGIIGSVTGELWSSYLWVRDRRALMQAIVSYAALVGLALVAAAALTLTLLHVGIAAVRPEVPAGEQVRAALEAHLWHLADAPAWDLPRTLHWNLSYDFIDRWSAGALLVSRLFLVAVLIVPVAQAVISFVHFRTRRPVAPTDLDAVARFARRFQDARTAIDRAADAPGMIEPADPLALGGIHLGNAAIYAAGLLTDELESVRQLFGAGEVTRHADAAVGTLLRRLDAGWALERAVFPHEIDAAKRDFRRLRDDEQRRYDQYRVAARSALTRSARAV
jgi:hypothetical protein